MEIYSYRRTIFRHVHKIAESDYELCHVCLSLRPSVRTEQLCRIFVKFVIEYFSKIYQENSIFLNIGQE